jgi:DNA-binding transcriptional ArsR family regulator
MKCLTDCCRPRKLADYKAMARVHKALASEARIMLVDCLKDCECSAGELTLAVGLDQSTISKHLSVLLAAGIVDNRKVGNTVRYRLLTPCILDMFACACKILKPEGEGDYLK